MLPIEHGREIRSASRLLPCPSCGKQVATSAIQCPSCGERDLGFDSVTMRSVGPRKCELCNGTGRQPTGKFFQPTTECVDCGGRGVLQWYEKTYGSGEVFEFDEVVKRLADAER